MTNHKTVRRNGCCHEDHPQIGRRDLLQVGGLSLIGMGLGGLPEIEAYTPEDLAATIFHCLGIGPDREFHDTTGRPYHVYRGQPIRALLRRGVSATSI